MRYEDLTDEQRERMNAGCSYNCSKLMSQMVLTLIILFCIPYLGSMAQTVTDLLMCYGTLVVSGLILRNTMYKETPLVDLKKELEEQNDLS